jgi:hypothetical protein
MRKLIVGAALLIAGFAIWLHYFFNTVDPTCARIHSKLAEGDTAKALTNWVDSNINQWEQQSDKKMPRYSFGAGQYLVPTEINPKALGLFDDAEAQAVLDSKGKIVLIELIDSKREAIIVTASPGRWYSWAKEDLKPVDDRVAVVCVSRD